MHVFSWVHVPLILNPLPSEGSFKVSYVGVCTFKVIIPYVPYQSTRIFWSLHSKFISDSILTYPGYTVQLYMYESYVHVIMWHVCCTCTNVHVYSTCRMYMYMYMYRMYVLHVCTCMYTYMYYVCMYLNTWSRSIPTCIQLCNMYPVWSNCQQLNLLQYALDQYNVDPLVLSL